MAEDMQAFKDDSGKKVHWISGMPITCNRGPDCQLCIKEKHNQIGEWLKSIPYPMKHFIKWQKAEIPRWAIGKMIKQICAKCTVEKIPCYQCLRIKCTEWFKEKERVGQLQGCWAYYDNYCKDWYCHHDPVLIIEGNRWWNDTTGIRP